MTWLAMPGVLSLSYLTHLAGPDAADLTLAGGMLSFRVFEYGILIALVLADVIWRRRLFIEPEELAILHREPEFEFDLDPNYEQDPAYVL